MEKFTLKVCTFADTETQEVILDATGGGFAAQIDVKKGEYPFMRRLTVMLYPAQDGEPEEEIVQTDIRPKEEWR